AHHLRAGGAPRRAGPAYPAERADARGRVRESGWRGIADPMPIHDQSYRRYRGGKASPGRAWTVITVAGIMTMIRKRVFLGLLIFAWLPFVVRAVQLYLSTNFPQMAILAPTAETFREFLDQQGFFVFLITI